MCQSKAEIAARNDNLRKLIPCIAPPDVLVVTAGVMALGDEAVADILMNVKTFNSFNPDNDPWGEHDCAIFDCRCQRLMFKIDDYNGQDGYRYVLTVLLADEY